jgi:DNA helicase HerA-like ATPase
MVGRIRATREAGVSSKIEDLAAFYLGRVVDPESGETRNEPLLYESKDLTTHALCVGMTGSGKTGLCIGLLEEAALDGIPAIAIDPKGDLGNLFLTFPKLAPEEFAPWIDPAEAARKGQTPERFAADTARRWREGLAAWDQGPARVRRVRNAVDRVLYTPGSRAGRPLRVLRSLSAPPPELLADGDALRDRVEAAVSGLLSLLRVDADPLQSREHILLSNLVDRAWREGRDLGLPALIAAIQKPPFEKLGVLDLESIFPAKDRFAFSLRLNNLLASPGFEAWMEGDPLDIDGLLYAPDGRPRHSVISIAHLSDPERMFFVTVLLNELIAWMRTQPGTSSLRALLYMDEIYGYFPPTANPPSKKPMLTLLKQARAFGVGVVLATQNPVDLDYKGLSNAGTWFLGRLQTERDKARVLDGLEGALAESGASLDRAALDALLSGLRSRVFLMHNVHDDRPELFETRWAMSYLRGPLTREQIQRLAGEAKTVPLPEAPREALAAPPPPEAPAQPPILPPDVPQTIVSTATPAPAGAQLVYRPALLASAQLHYADRKGDLDHWQRIHLFSALSDEVPADPWSEASVLTTAPTRRESPETPARFAEVPAAATRAKRYATWGKRLKSALYRDQHLSLFHAPKLRRTSRPGESEAAFRASLVHAVREKRDMELEKLRARYAPKLARLEERVRTAEAKVEVERDQHKHQKLQTAVSIGATVLGALFGRKVASSGNVGRAATAARGAGRISREARDVGRAEERLDDVREKLAELETRFEEESGRLSQPVDPRSLDVQERPIKPRKADIAVEELQLAWMPWWLDEQGIARPAFEIAAPAR